MQIILFFSSKGLAVTAYTLIMNIHEKRYTQYILMLVLLQFLRQGGAASGVVGEVGGVSRMRDSWVWDGPIEDFLATELRNKNW